MAENKRPWSKRADEMREAEGDGCDMAAWREWLIDRMERFTERLESGEPIEATQVQQHETPDGPMHTFKKGVLIDGEFHESN